MQHLRHALATNPAAELRLFTAERWGQTLTIVPPHMPTLRIPMRRSRRASAAGADAASCGRCNGGGMRAAPTAAAWQSGLSSSRHTRVGGGGGGAAAAAAAAATSAVDGIQAQACHMRRSGVCDRHQTPKTHAGSQRLSMELHSL